MPSYELSTLLPALKVLWQQDPTPVCFLDGARQVAYANAAFRRLAARWWPETHTPRWETPAVPERLLVALEEAERHPAPSLVTRLSLGVCDGSWDVHLQPYPRQDGLVGTFLTFHDRTAEHSRMRTLEREHQAYEATLANIVAGVLLVTPRGTVELKNEPAVSLFQAPGDRMVWPLVEFRETFTLLDAHGKPLPAEHDPFIQAAAGRGLQTELYVLSLPRTCRYLRISVTPLLPLEPGPMNVLLTCLDVTREQMNQDELELHLRAQAAELLEAKQLLEQLFEAVPSVMYFVDAQERVQMANPYLLKRLGRQQDQVLGRPIAEVLSLTPEQRTMLECVREQKRARRVAVLPYWEESRQRMTFWDTAATPILDEAGQLRGVLVLSTDVTWRVELTQALTEKVDQLRAIVDHISDGVLVATPKGQILLANDAVHEHLGLPPDSHLDALEDLDVRTLDDRRLTTAELPLTRVLRGERVGEMFLKVGDGGRVLAVGGTPILDEHGQVTMGVMVCRDMSEEYQLRRALTEKVHELQAALSAQQELDRLKSDFLNTMSHELRTPLTAIIGYSEFLEDAIAGPLTPKQLEFMRYVSKNANHLLNLINDLLDFARLEAGKLQFTPSPIKLTDVIEQTLPGVRAMAQNKRIRLYWQGGENLPDVRADYTRVQQVLGNLLDNAVKFTPEGGSVFVRCKHTSPREVLVEIEDTGIGIPEQAMSQVFTKFFQVESGLRREQGGAGLGLAISKLLIEAQGGHIGLESKPECGTRVWFSLPIWTPEPEAR